MPAGGKAGFSNGRGAAEEPSPWAVCFPAGRYWSGIDRRSGMEIVYFVGAFILLVALIYGTLSYRYRNRAAARLGGEIAAERYRRDET
jgi:hypothetical protein